MGCVFFVIWVSILVILTIKLGFVAALIITLPGYIISYLVFKYFWDERQRKLDNERWERNSEIAKKNSEDRYKRFIKAAIEGTDPKDVFGFEEVERHNVLKDSVMYPKIKEMCIELVKKGYTLGGAYVGSFDGDRGPYAIFSVYKDEKEQGSITFRDGVPKDCIFSLNNNYIDRHIKERTKFHTIQLFPYIIIESKVALPEEPPEWLMICANVIKKYKPSVPDPDWVNEPVLKSV